MKKLRYFLLLTTLFCFSCQERDFSDFDGQVDSLKKKEVLWLSKPVNSVPGTKTIGVKDKYWQIGDTIRIKFLNGDAALQQKVKGYAELWLAYANLYFEYVDVNAYADVKIGFNMDDRYITWCTLGTDCKAIPQNEPSLNFYYNDPSEAEFKGDVLRVFGHIMGLDFEHKHPASPIAFKPTADIAGEYSLSEQEVLEFKRIYMLSEVDTTAYDKNCIMMLPIPRYLVIDRNSVILSANTVLSVKDKKMITKIYPMEVITMTVVGKDANICVGSTYWQPGTEPDDLRKIDWGDGRKEMIAKDGYYYHIYSKDSTWIVRLYGNTTTYKLFVSTKNASTIDVTKSKELETLYCDDGTLQSLDLSQNPNLKLLSCMNNNLTELDLSHNTQLQQISCNNNALTSLNVKNFNHLIYLWCENNRLSSLNVATNPLLRQLTCYNNSFDIMTIAENLLARPADVRGLFFTASDTDRWRIQDICKSKNWDVCTARAAYSLMNQGQQQRPMPFRGKLLE